jgi:predicted metal-dependent hydrolase
MPQQKAHNIMEVSGHSIIVIKSNRRKTMAIKVNDDGIFLHIPNILPLDIAQAFVHKKIAWIEQKLQYTQKQVQPPQYREGDSLLLFGQHYEIKCAHQENANPTKICLQDGTVLISKQLASLADGERQSHFHQWYQQQASVYLVQRSEALSQKYHINVASYQVKGYKARWGSCSHDGHIRYNWKIIQAPVDIIDYLIIHELCHILEHNHSKNFWALVARYCPDYKQRRQWLKTHGHAINHP